MKRIFLSFLLTALITIPMFGQYSSTSRIALTLNHGWNFIGLSDRQYMIPIGEPNPATNLINAASMLDEKDVRVHPFWYEQNTNEAYEGRNYYHLRDLANTYAVPFNYTSYTWQEDYLFFTDENIDVVRVGTGIMVYNPNNEIMTIYPELTEERDTYMVGDSPVNVEVLYNPTIAPTDGKRWFALANPYYYYYESVADLIENNSDDLQGQGVYVLNNGINMTWTFLEGGEYERIERFQGFFVQMNSNADRFTHIATYERGFLPEPGIIPPPIIEDFATKTSIVRESVKISVESNNGSSSVMLASNPSASTDYDIYDADKLFGNGSVAEPYLVSNGKHLCKEEVDVLPYTTEMNVYSIEAKDIRIVAERIPEAYTLILLDGGQEIELQEGDVYTTDIASGENANRFSLKIGKNAVSLQDMVKAEELNITNNNRHITINGGNDVHTEIYNALGQQVYQTNERTLELNGVASGAYIVKSKSGNTIKTHKLVIQ